MYSGEDTIANELHTEQEVVLQVPQHIGTSSEGWTDTHYSSSVVCDVVCTSIVFGGLPRGPSTTALYDMTQRHPSGG